MRSFMQMFAGGWVMAALSVAVPAGSPSAETVRPNVVIILADDLGYGDVRCYNPGGKIPTPHIDRLASEGMMFTDAHSSSGVCSPSRYALLTGRYHWRSRLQTGIVGIFGAPLIAPDRLTIAGLAKQHGYRTAAIGKWHLGWDWPISEEQRGLFQLPKGKAFGDSPSEAHLVAWREVFGKRIPGGPTTRGFDEYFGTDVPNWPPYCFIENDRTAGMPSEFLPRHLLKNHLASAPGPALPGWELEPILPSLGERARDFIRRQAGAGQSFLLYMPLTAPHTPLAVTDEWKDKSGLCSYADFVMETDAVIGRVLGVIDAAGATDNTLVILTSDNGCAPYIGAKEMEAKGHRPSGPLRGYKGDAWEGGHREPFIVRWPRAVKAGSVCDQLVHHTDILATLADILGAPLPDNAGEDSFSILPLLKGGTAPIRQHAVSCAASGIPALRDGQWKMIAASSGGGAFNRDPKPIEPASEVLLFNLAEDLGETRNLAAAEPRRAAEMRAMLERLIIEGRSRPGPRQSNDVEVVRFPKPKVAGKKKGRTGG